MLGLIFFRIQRQQEPKLLTAPQGPRLGSKPTCSCPESSALISKCLPQRDSASSSQKEKLHNFWKIVPLTQRDPFSPQNPCPAPPLEHIPHPGLSAGAPVRWVTMSIDAPMCLDSWEARGCSGWVPHKGELRALTCLLNTYSFQGGPMTPAPSTHPSGTNIRAYRQSKAITKKKIFTEIIAIFPSIESGSHIITQKRIQFSFLHPYCWWTHPWLNAKCLR